jgi:glyoxylase-like metal-dependent hydrolase (beta-lactamase superfamily II)
MNYFIENYLSGETAEKLTVPATLSEQKILKDFTREYWRLGGVPAYPVGANKMISAAYNCGTTITDLSTANRDKSDVTLQRIEKTTEAEFTSYLAKLESFGFKKEYENLTSENLFLTYKSADQQLHLSFKPLIGEVQIITDPNGISVEEFGYSYTPKAGERSEYYLYGLPMTDCNGNKHPNCGTLSIIKCADNSVIIIDGGEYEGEGGLTQMYGNEVMKDFDAFLHQITGTADGDKVRVSGWYLSHYHSDHTRGMLEFFGKYNASYEMERVIANIPVRDCGGDTYKFSTEMTNWVYKLLEEWSAFLKTTYPGCKELKVHAGQKIQIADVSLEVLYTHEDLLTSMGYFNSADSNDTSTVVRVDNGQMSMIIMGDAGQRTESRMRKTFTAVTLKSDIVQPAHHLIYDVMTIFREIQPAFALVTQSVECMQSSSTLPGQGSYKERYDKLMSLVPRDHCYFAGNESVGLAVVNGKIEVIYNVEGVVGREEGKG